MNETPSLLLLRFKRVPTETLSKKKFNTTRARPNLKTISLQTPSNHISKKEEKKGRVWPLQS
jgi:hypothetical protein